jgi:hypothetical protein
VERHGFLSRSFDFGFDAEKLTSQIPDPNPGVPYGNMTRMGVFLLWATLGIYAVGVVAVVLAALLLVHREV